MLRKLTQTVLSANPSGWRGFERGGGGCGDCYEYVIVIQRRESDGIERTYGAYWDEADEENLPSNNRVGRFPEELRELYDTFWAHKRCKQ